MNEMHLTKSHLLRRLLQRRVELLENERATLRAQVEVLESRLSESAAAAPPQDEAGVNLNHTLQQVRAIGERAQAEATLTLRITRQEQEQLASQIALLQQESQQLRHLVTESVEGVNSILEQAQGSAARLVREAHLQQEQLGLEVERLYQDGSRPTRADLRRAAFMIDEQAQQAVHQIEQEAQAERSRLLADVATLRQHSEQLHEALAIALERAHAITRQTERDTQRAIEAEPQSEALPPLARKAQQHSGAQPSSRPRPYHTMPSQNEDLILQKARRSMQAAQRARQQQESVEEWTGPLLLSVSSARRAEPISETHKAQGPALNEGVLDSGTMAMRKSVSSFYHLPFSFTSGEVRRIQLLIVSAFLLGVLLLFVLGMIL